MAQGSHTGYPDRPEPAVGAVVFRNGCVLLVKRGQPPSENLWAIPGGRVKLGESLQDAAQREVLEETGLDIRAGEPVHTFDVIERDPAGDVRYHYVIVDLKADYLRGEVRPGDDAADARWIAEKELPHLEISRPTKRLLKEIFGFGE